MPRYHYAHFRSAHGPYGKRVDGNTKGAVAAYGTIAKFNRWNGKPHEHTREIARRTMTPKERREMMAAGDNV